MIVRVFSVASLLVALVAAQANPPARSTLRDARGSEVGRATFHPAKGGVRIAVQVSGLPPGRHGIHIHAVGRCDPPGFESAGGHLNPEGRQHGHLNPQGAHAGDLPNLAVGQDGSGTLTYTARGVELGEGPDSLFGPQGTALVIHAGPDDEKTDPAGGSGPRLACGVIERA